MDQNNDIQLERFEDLITQSTRGLHPVFDHSTISEILKKPVDEESYFTVENMTKAQDLLNIFLKQDNAIKRQKFLGGLDTQDYELLLRTYFHLVESSIRESINLHH